MVDFKKVNVALDMAIEHHNLRMPDEFLAGSDRPDLVFEPLPQDRVGEYLDGKIKINTAMNVKELNEKVYLPLISHELHHFCQFKFGRPEGIVYDHNGKTDALGHFFAEPAAYFAAADCSCFFSGIKDAGNSTSQSILSNIYSSVIHPSDPELIVNIGKEAALARIVAIHAHNSHDSNDFVSSFGINSFKHDLLPNVFQAISMSFAALVFVVKGCDIEATSSALNSDIIEMLSLIRLSPKAANDAACKIKDALLRAAK